VLNKAEVDSRFHISVEKYVKQMGIERTRREHRPYDGPSGGTAAPGTAGGALGSLEAAA
jgi:hypothetical protein